jgi:hypothetical protein
VKALKASRARKQRSARRASKPKLFTVTYRVDDIERKAIVRYAARLSNEEGARVSQNTAMRKVLRVIARRA